MIILRTNTGLKATFEKLIQTMKEPIEWNGQFVAVGDYLILHGRVRSLFFNFEKRTLDTNIIDIPVDEEEVVEIGDYAKLQNVLNLTLYAFGKWGLLRRVKVDQDYAQLNALFQGVLREISVEPGYSRENFRFYQNNIRITYEDVISLAVEAREHGVEEGQAQEGPSAGLWHKLVWKKRQASFSKLETDFEERQKNRMGNNFYMVSYLCPKCREHLHMAVFPVGREFRVETSEGGVFLARAYSCGHCNCFYTPLPERLLEEGGVYAMDFLNDRRAYEDYLELLGAQADRVSNYKFNEYEEVRRRKEKLGVEDEAESLEEACANIDQMPDPEWFEVAAKMEEGFYPAGSTRRLEGSVRQEAKRRRRLAAEGRRKERTGRPDGPGRPQNAKRAEAAGPQEYAAAAALGSGAGAGAPYAEAAMGGLKEASLSGGESASFSRHEGHAPMGSVISPARQEAAKKRYKAKCSVLDRLSPSQVEELKGQLMRETDLREEDKQPFLRRVLEKERMQKRERVRKLALSCEGQKYAKMQRIIREIEKIDLPDEDKSEILPFLYKERKKQGEAEAAELLEAFPKKMDLRQYQEYMGRLKEYQDVDFTPYAQMLEEKRKQAEDLEIAKTIRHARVKDRASLVDLIGRLKGMQFTPEAVGPYLEELHKRLTALDESAIEEICGNPAQMTADQTMEAYKKVEAGDFLPELKSNALELLRKRLAKLKTDECELLVHKFQDNLQGRIKESARHHFYPARRIMTKEAKPEEHRVIDFALETYGAGREIFEYPILVIDSSRDKSGKEGVILTPDHLFYRTMLNAFAVPIGDIRKIHSQTGIFNSGIFVELKDGTKFKIPHAVERKELVAWGNCLEEFIYYLQEKPDSRKLTYLAKETHETICCFRCGYSYHGGNVCPKCGYKMNQ